MMDEQETCPCLCSYLSPFRREGKLGLYLAPAVRQLLGQNFCPACRQEEHLYLAWLPGENVSVFSSTVQSGTSFSAVASKVRQVAVCSASICSFNRVVTEIVVLDEVEVCVASTRSKFSIVAVVTSLLKPMSILAFFFRALSTFPKMTGAFDFPEDEHVVVKWHQRLCRDRFHC